MSGRKDVVSQSSSNKEDRGTGSSVSCVFRSAELLSTDVEESLAE
jgi:hypothetical protein